MTWNTKAANNLQVFRGSKPRADVFTQDLMQGSGCCPDGGATVSYDKLARRVRFDNGLSHLNPLGGNEKFQLPLGDGFSGSRDQIVAHINKFRVGARISVIAIPTFAFVTGVGIHVAAEEPGLTFNLITRNGLVLPAGVIHQVTTTGEACLPTRTLAAGDYTGFGALGNALYIDIFGRSALGEFSLESDEIIVEVATMPASGVVKGDFDIRISASYELQDRAEV